MHLRLIPVLAAFAFMAGPAVPAAAQQADPATALPSVLRRAASERWLVRVTALDSSSAQGRVWKVDPDSAHVGDLRVAQANLAMIERMERDNSGVVRGALIGGAATSAVIGTFSAFFYATRDPETYYVVSAVVGAFIFGTIGGMVDPGDPDWQEVWRRPNE